jgi:hypothetical protein
MKQARPLRLDCWAPPAVQLVDLSEEVSKCIFSFYDEITLFSGI